MTNIIEISIKKLQQNKTDAHGMRSYYNNDGTEKVIKNLYRNNMKEYITTTNINDNKDYEGVMKEVYENNTGTANNNINEKAETRVLDVDEYNKIKKILNIFKFTNTTPNKRLSYATRETDENNYFFQGQWIQKPKFVSGKLDHFYLFSAFMGNISNSPWSKMRILGQWHSEYYRYNQSVKCCFKYSDKTVVQKRAILDKTRYRIKIGLFNIMCSVPKRKNVKSKWISEVGISFYPYSCESLSIPYIRPFYALIEKNTLGICTKIAYNSLSSSNLIEWLEAMQYLGVDKVITYADSSLNRDAVRTLQYYERTGLVDLFPYNQPGKDIAYRDPGMKKAQVYEDGLLTIYDSFERLRGFTYISVLDIDEYLIPSRNRSLKQLMNNLFQDNIKNQVAGFAFKTNFFIKSWGKVNPSNKLELGQYTNRTEWAPKFDRRKLIVMNDRVNLYSSVHSVKTQPGYNIVECPESEAYMRHYRPCRQEWNKDNQCMTQFKRVTDLEMINWATKTIATRVGQVTNDIFGKKVYNIKESRLQVQLH